ncbi:MAG: hypothetical protein IPL61_23440 [Myxococcales bacterium]|nr:hypothetical protein [Myxococcales bacterium]
MTESSRRALEGLRDPHTLQWYVIPLLALLFYIYAIEIKKARATGDWNAVLAGLTLFGMDFVNESINGWILVLTDRSALWTAPGPTALRTMVGWNVEIMFMFAIAGIIFYHSVSPDPRARLLGLPERWLIAALYAAFCVVVELVLNAGGLLVWEYPFWNGTLGGVWLIFALGYFHFYAATILVVGAARLRTKLVAIAAIYGVAIALDVVGLGLLGWTY